MWVELVGSLPAGLFLKSPETFRVYFRFHNFLYPSSQRQGCKPKNFAILLGFPLLKTCQKLSVSKEVDCSLITSGFSGLLRKSPQLPQEVFFFRLCTPVFHSHPKATFHLMFYVISYDLFPISPHNGALVPGCLHLRRKKSDLDSLYYSGFVNSSRNVFSL